MYRVKVLLVPIRLVIRSLDGQGGSDTGKVSVIVTAERDVVVCCLCVEVWR